MVQNQNFPGKHAPDPPPKDTKVDLLLNFWGRAECTWKRNTSLLQVGLEPWTFRSAVQCFNQ